MNFYDIPFCTREIRSPLTSLTPACDYTKEEPDYSSQPDRSPAFSIIQGTVVEGNVIYSTSHSNCVSYYELTVETDNNQTVAVVVTSNTYPIDCGPVTIGTSILAFYTSLAETKLNIPAYEAIVICFNLPKRFVKVDYFDCYLVSQDKNLRLSIGDNTYVVDRNGRPFCGSLSNKYLIVLYKEATKAPIPKTEPTVVIVL